MDHYILTIYREDDTTPWIEVGTAPNHPRPYLHVPGEVSRGDIDLRQGKALVGEMQVRVIDPQTGTDQSERWITERLGIPQGEEGAGHSAINGRRAVLQRASGRLVMDGVVTGVTLSESFAGFSFALRDIRERHRRISLFTRTCTASVLPRGVVNGYGQLPGGGWLIEPTVPLRCTFHQTSVILGGAGFFDLSDRWSGVPIHDHNATVPPELVLTEAMRSVLEARGDLALGGRYEHVAVWWRALSGDTSWRIIERPGGGAVYPHWWLLNTAPARLRDAGERDGEAVTGIYSIGVAPGLLGTAPLPSDGQEVDVMVVYIGPPSEQYPFHWEGTAGKFLRNLYRGDWSDALITTHVDEAALLALDTPIRIRLTEAPKADDSREWIESIYRALRAAPALDLQGRISPVTAAIPPAGEMLPELTDQNCQPIPGWSHPTSDAVTAVAVTYERDFRVPVEADPLGERSAGDGLASVEVRVEHRAPDWVIGLMGEHVHEIDGWMFRALGGIDGEPATGDITDETGARVAERAAREILDRYVFGGQVSFARIRAADFPTLRAGSWLIDRRSWRPNYRTGTRGGETLVQVMSVHEVDPAWLEIRMVDAGPADQPLSQPTLGTPTVTADAAVQIPVTSVPAGGEAAVYYAVGATAPVIGSGAWRFAGRTDAPGPVLTPPQPDGATVWITARGEGLGRRPSGYTTPVSVQIPVTARVREVRITFDAAGVPTVHWVPGAHTQGIRVRWIVHDIADPAPVPGSPIDVAASAGSLQLPATVRAHEAVTVDVEPWTGWTGSSVSGTAGPAVRTAASPLAPTGVLYAECRVWIVDSDATTVTIQVDATPAHAEVHLLGMVKATRLSGPAPGVPAPSGTQWVFSRPAFQQGEGQAVFRATAPGYESDDDHIVIPEQGRDTVGLVMRASVQQVTPTQITVRVAVADPQPGAGNVTITYVATGGAGLAVTPGSPQTIPAAQVTSDLDTTGFVDVTITRPEAGSGGGRVTFTATRSGRVADVDAVDVPELPPTAVQLPPRALIRVTEYTSVSQAKVQITGAPGGMGAAAPTQYRWRQYAEGATPLPSYSAWAALDGSGQATVTALRRPKGFQVVEAQVRTAAGLESEPVTIRIAPDDSWQDDTTGGPKWSEVVDDDGNRPQDRATRGAPPGTQIGFFSDAETIESEALAGGIGYDHLTKLEAGGYLDLTGDKIIGIHDDDDDVVRPGSALWRQATSRGQNLLGPFAGPEHTHAGVVGTAYVAEMIEIASVGLIPGDVVSLSAYARNTVNGNVRIGLRFRDASNSIIDTVFGAAVFTTTVRRAMSPVEDVEIPAGTVTIEALAERTTSIGGGATFFTDWWMLNRGRVALPFEQPPGRPARERIHVWDGTLRPTVTASDGAAARLLPKGVLHGMCWNGSNIVYEQPYQNTPIPIVFQGPTMDERAVWWQTVDEALSNPNSGSARTTGGRVKQVWSVVASASGFTPRLVLANIGGAPSAKSIAFSSSPLTEGQASAPVTPPGSPDTPSVGDRYTVTYSANVLRGGTTGDVQAYVTVAVEVSLNGGAYAEMGTDVLTITIPDGFATGNGSGSFQFVAMIGDGDDRVRLRFKRLEFSEPTPLGGGNVTPGSLSWSALPTAQYANATPDGEADALPFVIIPQS